MKGNTNTRQPLLGTRKPIPGLPLAGLKVIDASRILAGPCSAQCLGDMGADVIKIEHPDRGDDTRDWGIQIAGRDTTYFYSMNRNKRSIGLNFEDPEDLAIVLKLVQNADVFIQNFKYGGAEKLGIGYEALAQINPLLVYCSISGYDRHSSEKERLGYDLVLQGETGLMGMNGNLGQPPLKFGVAVVDLFTGLFSAQAILAALYEREKTGCGSHVEMSLYNSAVQLTAYYGLEALALGRDPEKWGNNHPAIVPYGVFEAADGPVVITVGNNKQFAAFCTTVIERPDIAEDPRFSTNLERTKNRDIIAPIIKEEVKKRPRAELIRRMEAIKIPCGEVNGLYAALTSERSIENERVNEVDHPKAGKAKVLNPPYRFRGTSSPLRQRPPMLAEHSSEILKDVLGFDQKMIANFFQRHHCN
ncbi:CoA transferase [uncultured Bartonella sp.]|uniref:CaiB/BaiF CoA transferase family protein n=1 Tax=uncultured Bartonella sp. TaxID=104108 RepID=UPI002611ED8B|nr:CoA transferase [uncultured Bartonella sp.]